ncbi:MAG: TRAP transporter substrate-binding protein [Acetobacteraceae bacterium]|nr:TRAP transporter substrate-binding protein [Acetobacteraceae bacterium]
MITTRRALGGLAAAAGLSAALPKPAVHAQAPIAITVGHVLSPNSAYQVIFTRMAELVRERTGGRVSITIQGGGAAGTETRIIQSMRTGILDGSFVGGSTLETVQPNYRVLSLPYIFDDHAQANRILHGPVGQEMMSLLEPLNLLGLGFGAIFERNIASRRAINSPADLQGLKIRVLPTPGFVEAYRAFGAQPTPMAFGEVFLALQNNVVDALEISADSVVADRFVEIITHYALTKVHQSTTVMTWSRIKWNSYPAEVQQILRASAAEAIRHGLVEHERLNVEGMATVRARGITVTEPPLAPFMELARRSYPTILAEAPQGQQWVERILAAKRQGQG